MLDVKTAFGIAADGSDETTAILTAFAAGTTGDKLYFGEGTYGVSSPINVSAFEGAGMEKTIFKNLGGTELFRFPSGLPGSYIQASGFTVDQSGAPASAIRLNSQFQGLRDVKVRNQGGGANGAFAIHCRNTTIGTLDHVSLDNCDNGLKLDTCYYLTARNISIERQRGCGLHAVGCAQTTINGIYFDNGNAGAIGHAVPEIALVESCTSFSVFGMSSEIAPGGALGLNIPVPNDSPERGYFIFRGVSNLTIEGLRINHYINDGGAYMLHFDECSARVLGTQWFENFGSVANSMRLFGVAANNLSLEIDGVETRNSASAGRYGLGAWYGKSGIISVRNWRDRLGACPLYLQASNIVCEQVEAPIVLSSGVHIGKRHFVNCMSIAGPGAAGASVVNTAVV